LNPKHPKAQAAAQTRIFKQVSLQAGLSLFITDQAVTADLHATAFKENECSNIYLRCEKKIQ